MSTPKKGWERIDGGTVEKASTSKRQVGGSHYLEMDIQPWDVMESVLTHEEWLGFLKGSIIKYTMRTGKKKESDDEEKAKHYMEKLAEVQLKTKPG